MIISVEFKIYLIIIALGFLTGAIQFKKLQQAKLVVILLGITFASELLTRILISRFGNGSYAYHFFNPVQIGIWGLFFYNITVRATTKYVVGICTPLLILFSIISSISTGLKSYPGLFLRVETLVLLLFGLLSFLEQIDSMPTDQRILANPIFLIVIAVIWFNLFSFLFFNFQEFFISRGLSTRLLRLIHYISNYVYYLILWIGMLIFRSIPSLQNR